MVQSLFKETSKEFVSGVAYKNVNLRRKVVSYFAESGNATITDLSNELKLSVPKITSIINDLILEGFVKDFGKVESTGGRKPNTYGLAPDSGFFVGIDVKKYSVNIGITDFQKNIIKIVENQPYELKNNRESLQDLCNIINSFIKDLPIPKDKILGIGVNLSGRINYATGYSYSFFNFQEDPLSRMIEAQVGIRVFLENDSRAMAYGEFCSGVVKDEKDVLFLNLDYGVGMGIMINGQLYYGKSGYSGEFGHIPVFQNEIICHCGKKGCLETEASGWALVELFKERLKSGSSTVLTKNNMDPENIQLTDIIRAAKEDDVLAIELIAKIGEKLGQGIALLINIFNPELVILGGLLATTEEYILLPIKSAVNKYSLSLMNNDTKFKMSQLGNVAGVIGACLSVRNRLLNMQ